MKGMSDVFLASISWRISHHHHFVLPDAGMFTSVSSLIESLSKKSNDGQQRPVWISSGTKIKNENSCSFCSPSSPRRSHWIDLNSLKLVTAVNTLALQTLHNAFTWHGVKQLINWKKTCHTSANHSSNNDLLTGHTV